VKEYFVYIVECKDGSYYTGITVNLARRVEEHNNSQKGAKYIKTRRPVKLIYSQGGYDRSSASKEEHRIKKLSKQEKFLLVTSKLK
jgi:putative endonuclease